MEIPIKPIPESIETLESRIAHWFNVAITSGDDEEKKDAIAECEKYAREYKRLTGRYYHQQISYRQVEGIFK